MSLILPPKMHIKDQDINRDTEGRIKLLQCCSTSMEQLKKIMGESFLEPILMSPRDGTLYIRYAGHIFENARTTRSNLDQLYMEKKIRRAVSGRLGRLD
ncbi:hypothetical protein BSLG_005997 [Batrachochytrium salamandrivorans]|nr:hypothetical protein BSLG_005997 [Batrachochytrium salamandrivorans]